MKNKTKAWIWVIVWLLITIYPFFVYQYGGAIILIAPFSGWLCIKTIIDIYKGRYD